MFCTRPEAKLTEFEARLQREFSEVRDRLPEPRRTGRGAHRASCICLYLYVLVFVCVFLLVLYWFLGCLTKSR